MSGRLPNVQRALVALLGTFVPIAPSMISGCGSNTPPATASAPDAGITWVSVITAGGGDGKTIPPAGPGAKPSSGDTSSGSSGTAESGTASGSSGTSESGAASGSSGAGSGFFFGSGTGSGSSGAPGSGHASGTSSGSGASLDGGNVSGSSGAAASDAAPGVCDNYQVTNCGTQACDLRANTCCVTLSFATRCLPGQNAACATNEATLHCSNGCECGGDTVCCGISNTIVGSIQSVCQSVPSGGQCQPYPDTTTMASAQFCKADSQCKNGQGCIHQTCTYMGISAVFDICGLQPGCM